MVQLKTKELETDDISVVYLITKQFTTPEEFSQYVESSAKNIGINLMEFLLEYCEQRDVDPISISGIITPGLKKKIQKEAESLNLLKPTKRRKKL